MIGSLISGVGGSSSTANNAGRDNTRMREADPLSEIKVASPPVDVKRTAELSSVQQKMDKAQSLIDDALDEDTKGFQLNQNAAESQKHDLKNKLAGAEKEAKPKSEKDPFAETNQYDDDFEYDIEEELPAEDEQPASARHVETSGQGITVSQSLGVDPSVDSLALEDYDHVEPVERLM